jgi:uncharacterized membrane protein
VTELALNWHTLAWRPFLDPLNLHAYWWAFLAPLALGVSFTYKAVRVPDLAQLPKQTVIMTAQVIGVMILLGLASFLFLEYLLPVIAPMPG